MDRIICNIKVDELEPNVLVITPFHNKGFDANSIYEFKLPDIKAKNGSILKSQKIRYITKPSIMYASIDDIKNKLGDIDIKDEIILYHIKEASRLVECLIQKAYEKQYVTFTKDDLKELRSDIEKLKDEKTIVWYFVVYKACYECLSTLYIKMATNPDDVKEVLSDLTKEFSYNLEALKDILDDFKEDFEEILDKIYTLADPVFALRGRLAIPINIDFGAPYYNINGMDGYRRSYNNFYFRGGHRF